MQDLKRNKEKLKHLFRRQAIKKIKLRQREIWLHCASEYIISSPRWFLCEGDL